MIFGYLTLFTALIISVSAAIYSILGLTAIFAAAFWPIVIMGGSLEVGKIVTTLWLHKYWNKAELQYKVYLCSAVVVLMFLTSMGVFGFLSKAHSDQALVSGDVTSKLEIYDEKIKTAKENIEADRKQLKQMDEAVDQVMARSTTEGGADKSNAIRKSQAKDRASLAKDIEANQKIISQLNDQAAPIRAEVRKVEADVGPIKYIAALIYGDNPDANLLEHAVRWVIILIVAVFDPLALTLLLAATKSLEWEHGIDLFNLERKEEDEEEEDEEEDEEADGDIPVFDEVEIPLESKYEADDILSKGVTNSNSNDNIPLHKDPHPVGWMFPDIEKKEEAVIIEDDVEPYGNEIQQHAMRVWKSQNPDKSYKEYINQVASGEISELPWEHPDHVETLNLSNRDLLNLKLSLEADNEPTSGEVQGFGTEFPKTAKKGDMFLRVDNLPSQLFKYNGTQWIKVNKNLSDSYIYDTAYIDHLIEKIGSGEYDPDLLSDIERERISEKLKTSTDLG